MISIVKSSATSSMAVSTAPALRFARSLCLMVNHLSVRAHLLSAPAVGGPYGCGARGGG